MELPLFTVDAFSSRPFCGNPAAVVLLIEPLPDDTLQKIALEMNLSETAFISPLEVHSEKGLQVFNEAPHFGLRWFTPTNEVSLCGHATVAAAHVLFSCYGNNNEQLEFDSQSGPLFVRRNKEHRLELDFPQDVPAILTESQQEALMPLVEEVKGSHEVAEVLLSPALRMMLVRFKNDMDRQTFESLKIDTTALLRLHDGSITRGIIMTLEGNLGDTNKNGDTEIKEKEGKGEKKGSEREMGDVHFVSRYIGVWDGIPEDPVTGSAHCVSGPYWAKKLDSNELKCRQASPRGGDLWLTVRDDGRIDISGNATVVLEGKFTV